MEGVERWLETVSEKQPWLRVGPPRAELPAVSAWPWGLEKEKMLTMAHLGFYRPETGHLPSPRPATFTSSLLCDLGEDA